MRVPFVQLMTALLLAAGASTLHPMPARSGRYSESRRGACSFQNNTDYRSTLNVHVAVISPAACCAVCAARADCAVGTFCPYPICPSPGQCYIKSNGTRGNEIRHDQITACFPGKSGPAPPPVPAPASPPPSPRPTPVRKRCISDLDCSLNGICSATSRLCVCYPPWSGHSCGVMSFKPSPRIPAYRGVVYHGGHSWGGSVLEYNGTYHMYAGDFFNGLDYGHLLYRIDYATASTVEGPYTLRKVLFDAQGVQAVKQTFANGSVRFVTFQSPGPIYQAYKPEGPFVAVKSAGYHGASEPAPLLHEGRWYTTVANGPGPILSAPDLEGPWSEFSNPGTSINWRGFGVIIEDPFLYIDARNHWHLLYHAYNFNSTTNCDSGAISLHAFSRDGKNWTTLSEFVQPYSSKVIYEDGSSHVFSTLERPKVFFDSEGRMTHIFNAAMDPSECHPTACVECKWNGTKGALRKGQVGSAMTIVRRLDYSNRLL